MKRRLGAIACLRCLAVLCLLGASGFAQAGVFIRVRVADADLPVRVSGTGLRVDGERVKGDSLDWSPAGSREVDLSAQGAIRIDDRRLAGRVSLIPNKGRVDVVHVVPLERYVERVVEKEVYASWPSEALKAQAVIARTYALHERAKNGAAAYDVEASALSQRYVAGPVDARVHDSSRGTAGEFLAHDGEPILAVFHSSAGGRTAAAEEVWGEHVPYLQSVASPDDDAPDHFWSYEIPRNELFAALAENGLNARPGDVNVLARSPSGRIQRVRVGSAELSGRDFRDLLGGMGIRSTLFDLRSDGNQVRFLGSGFGHGVGLSQWGAYALARKGRSYAQILSHYYRGTVLKRLPAAEVVSR